MQLLTGPTIVCVCDDQDKLVRTFGSPGKNNGQNGECVLSIMYVAD